MTLITRIITKSSVYIASDDQLNDEDGFKIGTTFKAFNYKNTIGAVAGLLEKKELKYDILKEINKYDSYEALAVGIPKDIPEDLQSIESIILLTESNDGAIKKHSILIQNGKLIGVEFGEPLFNPLHMDPIIGDTTLNFYKKGILSRNVTRCFDAEFYHQHLDFNWCYSSVYSNNKDFLHSLFHVKLFDRYGESSLRGLMQDNDCNITDFLLEIYSFIDSLKSDNGQVGREIFKGYYRDDNEVVLKTIGKCNSIMKLDIENGVSILYQKCVSNNTHP